MEKVIVVGFAGEGEAPLDGVQIAALNDRCLAELDAAQFPGVALQVEDHDATAKWRRRTASPARRVVAVLATWTEDGDDLEPLERLSDEVWPDRAVCVATETIPRWDAPRTTNAAAPQPGVVVTSLLYRRPGMTPEEFADHWRDVHQPMSLRIHPQHTYVRNLVTRWGRQANAPFDAISEEGFATVDDVLDPSRFFGADVSAATWKENARTIGDDVALFLDTTHTTATIMHEYRLRDFRVATS